MKWKRIRRLEGEGNFKSFTSQVNWMLTKWEWNRKIPLLRMTFGIGKCALLERKNGIKMVSTGIELSDGKSIKEIDGSGYKYRRVLQMDKIPEDRTKSRKRDKYIRCIEKLLQGDWWKFGFRHQCLSIRSHKLWPRHCWMGKKGHEVVLISMDQYV